MNITDIGKKVGIKPIGVVHVGAHAGQEAESYKGLKQLYIEPIPKYAKLLREKGLEVIEAAASDYDGQADFHITTFDQGSSLLVPLEHKVGTVIKVPVGKLKNLVKEAGYNYLVIDTQGSELQVLKGADLDKFDVVICETSTRKRYQGAATEEEILRYMWENRYFLPIIMKHAEDGVINDCVFVRLK